MFKTILKEFKNAPLGTTSACVGLTALPSALAVSAVSAPQNTNLQAPVHLLLASLICVGVAVALGFVTSVFLRGRTPAAFLIFLACSLLLGSSVAIVAASAVFGGAFNAAWRMVLIVIGLPAWLLYAAIVVERDQIQRRETIMPGPSKATRPSVFNFVEHPDFQWVAIMIVGLTIGGAASVFTWVALVNLLPQM